MLVSAFGTGGTLSGAGALLKERKPSVRVVAVEPAAAAVLSGGSPGQHLIPGIGVGFLADVLDRNVVDEVIAVGDADAFATARRLARAEGILAGASSGAAAHAALAVAGREASRGQLIVVILPCSDPRIGRFSRPTPIQGEGHAFASRPDPAGGTACQRPVREGRDQHETQTGGSSRHAGDGRRASTGTTPMSVKPCRRRIGIDVPSSAWIAA